MNPERAARRAGHATRVQFFCSGFLFATWGVHIPTLRAHYGIDEAGVGLALLAAGVGTLLGLTQATRLLGRHAPRRIAAVCGPMLAIGVGLVLAMPSYAGLLALLVVFGLGNGLFDVAINTEAADLERRIGAPLMSGMHALFSVGGMAGAAAGSALLALSLAPWLHLALVALGMTLAVLAAAWYMLPRAATDASGPAGRQSAWPRGPLLAMGLLAAIALVAEGAMYDWSVLYLQQEMRSPQSQAALAYAAFSGAMAAARFAGDALRARFAAAPLLRASGWLAAAGMALALLAPGPGWALAGFALAGLGFANVVPVLFAAAGTVPGVAPARGIAAVSALGYVGLMTGPTVIGFAAGLVSLTAALWLVVVCAAVLAVAAPRVATR